MHPTVRICLGDLAVDEVVRLLASVNVELVQEPDRTTLHAAFSRAVFGSARKLEILLSEAHPELAPGYTDFTAAGSATAAATYVLSCILGLRPPLLTADPATFATIRTAVAAASNSTPVLVEGETGTGKELLVRLIHAASQMPSGPLVSLNCAGLDKNLLKAELLGERDDRPGSESRRAGCFNFARGGTLFLDRVNELPNAAQGALAELMRNRDRDSTGPAQMENDRVRYIGCATLGPRPADAPALDAELSREFAAPPLLLPPLRKRPMDIPIIARALLFKLNPSLRLSDGAITALSDYPFPGNVRELQNLLTRLVLPLSGSNAPLTIEAHDVQHQLGVAGYPPGWEQADEETRRAMVLDALETCAGDYGAAARGLRVPRHLVERYAAGNSESPPRPMIRLAADLKPLT